MHIILTHRIHNKKDLKCISEFYVLNKGFCCVGSAFMLLYRKLHNRAMHSHFNLGTIWHLWHLKDVCVKFISASLFIRAFDGFIRRFYFKNLMKRIAPLAMVYIN